MDRVIAQLRERRRSVDRMAQLRLIDEQVELVQIAAMFGDITFASLQEREDNPDERTRIANDYALKIANASERVWGFLTMIAPGLVGFDELVRIRNDRRH